MARLLPALTISEDEMAEGVARLDRAAALVDAGVDVIGIARGAQLDALRAGAGARYVYLGPETVDPTRLYRLALPGLAAEETQAEAQPPKQQVCVLETSLGTMVLRFFEERAPLTSANFKRLVESGQLGAKTGSGFYVWEKYKAEGVNPDVARYRIK